MRSIDQNLKRVGSGKELTEKEIDFLRGYQETIEDALEVMGGNPDGAEIDYGPEVASGGFAIVVGHTKNAPGATGVFPVGKSEYPWNTDLANKIKASADTKNFPCKIFFRDGIGISGVYKQVSNWGAACVVELHFNAANAKATGTETLYDKDKNTGSKAWAKKLNDDMVKLLGLKNRGLLERGPGDRGYGSVSALNIPSALIEPFFGDNPSDAKIGEKEKNALAEAIAEAAGALLKVS